MESAMRSLVLHLLAILVSLFALAGCGGSGTDGGGTSSMPEDVLPGAPLPGATAAAAPIRYGDVITLKSAYWRQYLSAQDGNSVQQARYPLEWEQWVIIDPNNGASKAAVQFNGTFRLKSVAKGSWLSAQQNSAIEQASAPQAWEVWQFQDPANSTNTGTVTQAAGVLLRNLNWNTYLSGTQGSNTAQASQANTWEQWLVLPEAYAREPLDRAIHYGDVITARGSFRTYLSAQDGTRVALADHPDAWEKWEVVNPEQWGSTAPVKFNGPAALYAVDKGRYLSAQDNANTKQVEEVAAWEKWKVIKPADTASTDVVIAMDTVAFASSRGTYLSAQQTVAQHVSPLGPWEKWVVARENYYRNWMAAETAIHDKKLREITLPASHDAGTWDFLDELSNDPEADFVKSKLAKFDNEDLKFGSVVGLFHVIDLNDRKGTIKRKAREAIRPLARATDRNIKQQLDAGVRWLDLRIDLRGGDAYTYHFLTGVRMAGVLDSVAEFLATTQGEIVVLEMSHIAPSKEKDASSVANYAKFTTMVQSKLGEYLYSSVDDDGTRRGKLMNRTYKEIVGTKSKAIVIMDPLDSTTNVTDYGFWSSTDVRFTGSYANMSNVESMLTDQTDKFKKHGVTPFKLFMTLTGQRNELQDRVTYPIYEYLAHEGDVEAALWFQGIFDKNDLKAYFDNKGLSYREPSGWRSLFDLSEEINRNLQAKLEDIQPTTKDVNLISVIYADYVGRTYLVDTAIRYSRMPECSWCQSLYWLEEHWPWQ